MELFGVGPLEFLMILVLALVIMGPQDMVGTARRIGQWIYRVVRSPTWRAIISTTQDLRELPQKIVRDAGLEEALQEVKSTATQVQSELAATTNEISGEMRAAGMSVSNEMNAAVDTLKNDGVEMAPLPIAYNVNTIWPEVSLAKHSSDEPPSVAEIIRTSANPYETQLGFFGESLQMGARPVVNIDQISRPVEPPPPPLPEPEFFAAALGSFNGLFTSAIKPTDYEIGPVIINPVQNIEAEPLAIASDGQVPENASIEITESDASEDAPASGEPTPSWALGIPTGLSVSGDNSTSMEERMQQMMQKLDHLDAQPSSVEEPPEESKPTT